MTATSFVRITLLAGALALSAPVFAADANMHDVYLAAEAGKFTEAQAMMDQVLRDHPNSGKAHYVEAELLAKQGKFVAAQAELANAERLAPGLPFAKAGAVEKLRTLLASPAAPAPRASQAARPAPVAYSNNGNNSNAGSSGPSWGLLLILGVALATFIVVVSRFMSRRQAQSQPYNPGYSPAGMSGNAGYAPGAYPQQGYGMGQGGMGQGGMPGQGSGIGSGIMGGLATGAAVGAGIVAGEALMHHFTDGNRDQGNHGNSNSNAPARDDIVYDPAPAQDQRLRNDDMGGNDFGVNDASSWDDAGSSDSDNSGSDW